MPELPEVEITRQSFASRIEGARVTGARTGKPLRWPMGCEVDALLDQTVGAVQRRGKYLWLPMDQGGLLLHLGMSGSLAFHDEQAAGRTRSARPFRLVTTRGSLRLTDPRRFGAVVWSPGLNTGVAAKLLAGLGLEPFDPALRRPPPARRPAAAAGWRSSRRCWPVTSSSAQATSTPARRCYLAGIDPRTRSDKLSRPRCERLARAVRETLARALDARRHAPCAISRTRTAWPAASSMQAEVYGREGEHLQPLWRHRSAASCRASARPFSAPDANGDESLLAQAPADPPPAPTLPKR